MLIPPVLTFQFALPVPRLDRLPRASGPLLDLPDTCRLLWPGELLDSASAPVELRAAWNPQGLGFSVTVTGRQHPPAFNPQQPDQSDGLRIWLHTRKARGVHRANRMCHGFHLMPVGGGAKQMEPQVLPVAVPRALEEASRAAPRAFPVKAGIRRDGWHLEAWLPAGHLTGFDPDASRMLGFSALLRDSELGDHPFTLGPAFPVSSDPELWQTLELVD